MQSFRNKKGSQIVEATMVMPLAVLIMVALISLMMVLYKGLTVQITEHASQRDAAYESKEVMALRLKDSLTDAGSQLAEENFSEKEGNSS